MSEPMRILLVEDDSRTALLIGEMLRVACTGRLVLTQTESVDQAVRELADHRVSCVLLDLSVTSQDVPETMQQLQAAAPATAILVLAEREDERAAVALGAGAQDHLVKTSLSPAALARAIRHGAERKQAEARLAELALRDPLTQLPNRALFLDRLGVALDRARRSSGTSTAVFFLDVDGFKTINDTLGHGAGDRVLATLAQRLRGMLRPMDTIARFGGDEFTLLFENLSGEREIVLIAERISRLAGLPIPLDEGEASVSVSIGISTVVDPTTPAETVLRESDAAMYRAKERGGARFELFDELSRLHATERMELEAALGRALERSELRVHYQPKVSLRDGLGVIGFEALVRWEHPERGLLGPEDFLPLAEETGSAGSISEFVLEEALAQISQWQRLKPGIMVSVNLSLRQLQDPDFATVLAAQIRATGIDPEALCVEVSEGEVTRNAEGAIRALANLKSVGVKIAIDDYGTGSASLSDLKRLPADALKIHQSFVDGLEDDGEMSVLGAVVNLGHALGLSVIAEGVETDLQLAQLRRLGCDRAQGYLLGAPVPGEAVGAMLTPA